MKKRFLFVLLTLGVVLNASVLVGMEREETSHAITDGSGSEDESDWADSVSDSSDEDSEISEDSFDGSYDSDFEDHFLEDAPLDLEDLPEVPDDVQVAPENGCLVCEVWVPQELLMHIIDLYSRYDCELARLRRVSRGWYTATEAQLCVFAKRIECVGLSKRFDSVVTLLTSKEEALFRLEEKIDEEARALTAEKLFSRLRDFAANQPRMMATEESSSRNFVEVCSGRDAEECIMIAKNFIEIVALAIATNLNGDYSALNGNSSAALDLEATDLEAMVIEYRDSGDSSQVYPA